MHRVLGPGILIDLAEGDVRQREARRRPVNLEAELLDARDDRQVAQGHVGGVRDLGDHVLPARRRQDDARPPGDRQPPEPVGLLDPGGPVVGPRLGQPDRCAGAGDERERLRQGPEVRPRAGADEDDRTRRRPRGRSPRRPTAGHHPFRVRNPGDSQRSQQQDGPRGDPPPGPAPPALPARRS